MPVDDRFLIREYRRGDEALILDLFARLFHRPQSPERWRWKYEANPWGHHRISMAFDQAGALVGHYAGYPVPFVDGPVDFLAHQVGDTMTDPSIRHIGRGPTSVLGRIAGHFYDHFCEGKVAFNYGFNVANIQKFSLRFLRSERVGPATYRTLSRDKLRALSPLERRVRGYHFEIVTSVDEEWDELFARARDSYGLLVRRDAQYVRWRYLQCPDIRYTVIAIRKWRRLVGWVVFRIGEGRFIWGDALFDAHHAGSVAVALRHLVKGYDVHTVETWFAPRPHWFSETLRLLGFVEAPEPQDLSLMCVPFDVADAAVRMRDRLFVAWGDSDLF